MSAKEYELEDVRLVNEAGGQVVKALADLHSKNRELVALIKSTTDPTDRALWTEKMAELTKIEGELDKAISTLRLLREREMAEADGKQPPRFSMDVNLRGLPQG